METVLPSYRIASSTTLSIAQSCLPSTTLNGPPCPFNNMERFKFGVQKFCKALNPSTDSSQGTTSKSDSGYTQLYAPAPALQIAPLPDGDSNISLATTDSPCSTSCL